jgi:dUTP pyrophosphatase
MSITSTGCYVTTSSSSSVGLVAFKIETLKLTSTAKLPLRANPGDAGADLWADESLELMPGESALVNTGISIKIPQGYVGLIDPRSSMRLKGLTCHGTGVIDSGYRGPLKVFIHNMGNDRFVIQQSITRIGQLTIVPCLATTFVDVWNDTERGAGGFGSTGQ